MARRTLQVRISDDNRDRDKLFLLTEMTAKAAEDWGSRALLALTAAGAEIPDDFAGGGMSAIAALGVQSLQGLKYQDVKPLMDEMFACVQIIPDPRNPQVVRDLVEDDIEEVSTRLRLRKEVIGIHVNFSQLASLSASMREQQKQVADPFAGGEIIRTSPTH